MAADYCVIATKKKTARVGNRGKIPTYFTVLWYINNDGTMYIVIHFCDRAKLPVTSVFSIKLRTIGQPASSVALAL